MDLKVLQIGSHIGKTEYDPVFKSVKYNDNAIFVEPVPWLCKQLVENYDNEYPNNSFIFINTAVSDKTGKIKLYTPSEKNDFTKYPDWASQLSSINENHIVNHILINSDIKDLIVDEINVEAITLNDIIIKFNIQSIELLHIDTEGHDCDILMNLDFQKVKPKKIMFEHKHMDGTNQIGIKYKKLLEHLKENDYIFCFKSEDDTMVELV